MRNMSNASANLSLFYTPASILFPGNKSCAV